MNPDFEARVSTLAERARAQADLNAHYSTKLDAIAAAKSCPAPGKCLLLKQGAMKFAADLEGLCAELAEVKRCLAEQRSGWKARLANRSISSTVYFFVAPANLPVFFATFENVRDGDCYFHRTAVASIRFFWRLKSCSNGSEQV